MNSAKERTILGTGKNQGKGETVVFEAKNKDRAIRVSTQMPYDEDDKKHFISQIKMFKRFNCNIPEIFKIMNSNGKSIVLMEKIEQKTFKNQIDYLEFLNNLSEEAYEKLFSTVYKLMKFGFNVDLAGFKNILLSKDSNFYVIDFYSKLDYAGTDFVKILDELTNYIVFGSNVCEIKEDIFPEDTLYSTVTTKIRNYLNNFKRANNLPV